MPTFQCNLVYTAVEDNLVYISNAEKQIPEAGALRVLAYMNGEHAEPMYAKGYHCSSNPVLAAQEFLSDRERYFACHKSKRLSGQGILKKEILNHHAYVSFSETDPVTPELLMQIADDFIQKMNLQDFRIFVAPHLNTKHKHFHMSICAYRMDGKRKFHMKNDTRYRCEMTLNQIAAGYGLSIIDHRKLRAWAEKKQPDYVEWLDAVKKEGKILVYENLSVSEKIARAEERKERSKNYSKKQEKAVEKQIQAAVRENKRKDTYDPRDYYTAGGKFPNVRKANKPYRVGLYSETGRKKGTLELLFILIATVLVSTEKYAREKEYVRSAIQPAWEIQRMIDRIQLAQKYKIANIQDLNHKKAEVGSWIGSHKKAIAYIEKQLVTDENEKLRARWQWHKGQYEHYRRQYRELMLVKETMRDVVREKYRYQIYDFEPIEEIKKEQKKQSLDEIISHAKQMRSPQQEEKRRTLER